MNAAHASYGKMTAVRDKVAGNSAGAVAAGTATGAALSVPISEYAKAEDSAMQLRVAMMNAGGQVQRSSAPSTRWRSSWAISCRAPHRTFRT